MLAPARVEVERGGICHIGSGVIRYERDVIAYLVLAGPAFKRIERVAYRYVRRPSNAAIGAVRIK